MLLNVLISVLESCRELSYFYSFLRMWYFLAFNSETQLPSSEGPGQLKISELPSQGFPLLPKKTSFGHGTEVASLSKVWPLLLVLGFLARILCCFPTSAFHSWTLFYRWLPTESSIIISHLSGGLKTLAILLMTHKMTTPSITVPHLPPLVISVFHIVKINHTTH